jgi:hypothetical protein
MAARSKTRVHLKLAQLRNLNRPERTSLWDLSPGRICRGEFLFFPEERYQYPLREYVPNPPRWSMKPPTKTTPCRRPLHWGRKG